MIEVKSLTFSYPCGRAVLQDISFSVSPGQCLAVLGNNGAGKSTLLSCLSRLLTPKKGEITVCGHSLLSLSGRQAAQKVALVPQTPPGSRLTVYDTVLLGRRPYIGLASSKDDLLAAEHAMEQVGISSMASRFTDRLSGGELQKVSIARALCQQPSVMLLDEPTSSLDLRSQHEVLGLICSICRQRGLSAVMVIHDLNLALQYCDRFLLLSGGRVFALGGKEVMTAENIQAVYGMAVSVHQVAGRPVVLPRDV